MNDIVTTVRLPRWLFQLIAVNLCIWIGFYAVMVAVAVDLLAGIGFFLVAAALIVPVLFLYYILWRYYWWLVAIVMTCSTLFFVGLLLMFPYAESRVNSLAQQSGMNLTISQTVVAAMLAVTVLPLLVWGWWRMRSKPKAPIATTSLPLFDFTPAAKPSSPQPQTIRRNDELTPIEFQNEVARLLIETNPDLDVSIRENQVDIDVYRDGHQIGIIRCKLARSSSPIAPLFVQEVHRLKERLGLSVAYIATTAQFNDDARELAQQLDIRILDGDKIKQYQRRSAKK